MKSSYILGLVAVLAAFVVWVFSSSQVITAVDTDTVLTSEKAEDSKLKPAELEEVELPLIGSGPLDISIEYIGDKNFEFPEYKGSLAGRVIDSLGEPLGQARIEVVGGPQDGHFAISDDLGKYQLTGLLPGTHFFRISSPSSPTIVRIQHIAKHRSSKRDFFIGNELKVFFEVYDYKNKKIEGAIVSSDLGIRSAVTNEEGIALLEAIPSGRRVLVDVVAPRHAPMRYEMNLFGNNTVNPIVINSLPQAGELRGHVKSWPGGEAPKVSILPRSSQIGSGMVAWELFQDIEVDRDGKFRFDNLPLNILLDVRVHHSLGLSSPRGRAITAGKGTPTQIDFIVKRSQKIISGTVYDEDKNILVGAEVELLAAFPMRVLEAMFPSLDGSPLAARLPVPGQLRRVTRTNSKGKFVLAVGDHIEGTGHLLLNVRAPGKVSKQEKISSFNQEIKLYLPFQSGGASLIIGRRLGSVLPAIRWGVLPKGVAVLQDRVNNLLEGYYRVVIRRDGKTLWSNQQYWVAGETKILL